MSFEEGTGDEFILTCFVCKNPFGLVAQFCGFCQATRQQALGIERSRTDQYIVTEPTKPIVDQEVPALADIAKPPKVHRQRFFIQNIRLRLDRFNEWQQSKAKPIIASASLIFSASAYILVQTYIFISYSPTVAAEDFMYKGITHQAEYFEMSPDTSTETKVFPVRFMKNQAKSTGTWNTQARWNGWLGNSEISIIPRGTDDSSLSVTTKFKPTYTKTLKIFRKISWSPAGTAAKIKINYPKGTNLAIYINGKSAGTTQNPAVPAGNYMSYPGKIEISFYSISSGNNIAKYERKFNVGTSGNYDTNF